MGGGAADQRQTGAETRPKPTILRQRRESPPPLLRERHGLQETAALPIPGEILAEIFLRLPTPADLIRASAACVSFRRVASDGSFLRRFRKRGARFISWTDLLPGLQWLKGMALFSWRQYAYGCFYWVTDWRELLLVLDTRRMEFSIAQPPPEAIGLHGVDIAFVEAGGGRPGMLVHPPYTNDLKYSIREHNCGSSSQWLFQRTISLDFEFLVMGSEGRHLFLFQWGSPSRDACCFSLDVETFQLERVFVSDSCRPSGHTYSNFPPSLLSTPRVSNGVEEGVEEMLEQGCAASSSA